jgi:hypothetical protein
MSIRCGPFSPNIKFKCSKLLLKDFEDRATQPQPYGWHASIAVMSIDGPSRTFATLSVDKFKIFRVMNSQMTR